MFPRARYKLQSSAIQSRRYCFATASPDLERLRMFKRRPANFAAFLNLSDISTSSIDQLSWMTRHEAYHMGGVQRSKRNFEYNYWLNRLFAARLVGGLNLAYTRFYTWSPTTRFVLF
ncbi:uncharacterized protein Bfra_004492 [Botrytis fragariae]|uniref:Uncharacterized protein n=1 Tax=Botrytis fragariae TaxID=1964551 RepID=A0A8H6AVN4_9HELO|nr:uncharacterized protein Bfra_004492 [Botrytis fragariae]KAF5874482.1 hypothetical protein Bfra_004492 [Botrytis fragariae]